MPKATFPSNPVTVKRHASRHDASSIIAPSKISYYTSFCVIREIGHRSIPVKVYPPRELLKNEYKLSENILEYVKERIDKNRNEIEKLLNIYKREFTYEEIKKSVEEEISDEIEYKKQINLFYI